jgi:hypothetical protein
MKRRIIAVTISLLSCAVAHADVSAVSQRQKPFLVRYADGNTERYVAKYTGIVDVSHWESGGPSTLTHPIDNRQCHWEIRTSIDRDVCLVSRSGEQFCQGSLHHAYGTSFAGQGSDFQLTQLHSENCGDANGRFNSDVNDAKNAVSAAMDGVMANDVARVQSDLTSATHAQSVTVQQ